LLLILLRIFNRYIIDTNNKDNNSNRVFGWGGVSSYLKVKFDFNYVRLSKPIVKKYIGSLSGPK
jgi:hypothetical protein